MAEKISCIKILSQSCWWDIFLKKKKSPWFLLPVIELDSDLRQFADSDEVSEISGCSKAADEIFFWDDIGHW